MVIVWAALLHILLASAADFSGPVVSVLDGDTIEVLATNALNASASAGSTARRNAKPTATTPSTRHLN